MRRRYGALSGGLALGACLIAVCTGCGCGRSDSGAAVPQRELLARMETSMGVIVIRLYFEKAPNTVANFAHLASRGFYNGGIFHRVIDGFMIQAGCPEGSGRGGPGWRIPDEFADGLRHDRAGLLSMANAGPNTGGSQFFITLAPTAWLDGKHAIFGEVVEGMEVVSGIGKLPTGPGDRPLEPPRIERVVLLRDGQPVTTVQPMAKTLDAMGRSRGSGAGGGN